MNFYALEAEIQAVMQKANVPGLALAIIENSEICYAKGFGTTSLESHGIPVTPATLFRFASVTKPMTSTLVMQLVEEGLLELDRPVGEYIDWLRFSESQAEQHITLRHLLSHTSGLPMNLEGYSQTGNDALGNFIQEVLPTFKLAGPPGKFWIYSNPGICLAAYLSETVTGQKYTQLMQERIFGPLGMQHSTFDPLVALTYPLALPHGRNEQGELHQEHQFWDISAFASAGGIISNVLDVAKFAILHLNRGKVGDKQLLKLETIDLMHQPIFHLPNAAQSFFGLAISGRIYKNIRQLGHMGGLGAYGSRMVFAPDTGCGVVIVFNWKDEIGEEPDRLVDEILDQLLKRSPGVPQPATVDPDKTLWESYSGTFSNPEVGEIVITEKDGQLIVTARGITVTLQALRPNLYYADLPPGLGFPRVAVGFIHEKDGTVRYITVNEQLCERL